MYTEGQKKELLCEMFLVFSPGGADLLPLSSAFGRSVGGGRVVLHAQAQACVDHLYQGDEPRNEYLFDVTFDRDSNNQSFSCDLQMRASDARNAIEDFRYGVVYDRKDYIAKSVTFPLSINAPNKEGKIVRSYIKNVDEFMLFKNSQLNPMIIAMIGCSNIRNVEVLKGSDDAVVHPTKTRHLN